jgi:2-hydroxy-6-oxonona-2,4-dienedioate hydrolase
VAAWKAEGGDLEGGPEGGPPPVLLVHGAGGGFDMGELMAQVLLGEDDRWIAPSRFGYLGSGVPEGAGPALQAHAFAWLLDELEIDRVAVVALSAGGPSASTSPSSTRTGSLRSPCCPPE